ncbi:glycosyltransferase family 4 protein [Pseudoalteromonas sp. SR45-6]|uniref:glycosyltransferase family 4 protein n=1 Tax=Pseudoalteromonas sp. SR45-6 TaxID=2760927 RepID=UPI0015FFEFCC|nr:glycosyltransferase family 4 protein [Pseudoalteromonas sp. SR45-6]MBB1343942.1 glycosyltransferase family 4 protein [Pseudoalteromonas sp. SR45-6]
MKVLMVCDFYDEGLEFQENLLSKYYNKYGHEVMIITSTYENVFDFYESRGETGVERIYKDKYGSQIVKRNYSYNLLNKIRFFSSLKEYVESFKPDVIYFHSFLPDLLTVKKYVNEHGVKLVVDLHMDYINSAHNWLSLNVLHKIIRKSLYKYVEKDIHKLFVVADSVKDFVNNIYSISVDKMELLPLGADTDLIDDLKKVNSRDKVREKYSIKENDIVIFCGGKLNPLKKIDLAIETYRKFNNSNLKLIVVGESSATHEEYYNKLKALSKDRVDIIFTGWLNKNDVYSHLLASDIGFFPSSQSILWQQAIASGIPLVVGLLREDESVDYLNCKGALTIHKCSDVNLEAFYVSLGELINNKRLLMDKKQAAIDTGTELLCWNRLIHKTLT